MNTIILCSMYLDKIQIYVDRYPPPFHGKYKQSQMNVMDKLDHPDNFGVNDKKIKQTTNHFHNNFDHACKTFL